MFKNNKSVNKLLKSIYLFDCYYPASLKPLHGDDPEHFALWHTQPGNVTTHNLYKYLYQIAFKLDNQQTFDIEQMAKSRQFLIHI